MGGPGLRAALAATAARADCSSETAATAEPGEMRSPAVTAAKGETAAIRDSSPCPVVAAAAVSAVPARDSDLAAPEGVAGVQARSRFSPTVVPVATAASGPSPAMALTAGGAVCCSAAAVQAVMEVLPSSPGASAVTEGPVATPVSSQSGTAPVTAATVEQVAMASKAPTGFCRVRTAAMAVGAALAASAATEVRDPGSLLLAATAVPVEPGVPAEQVDPVSAVRTPPFPARTAVPVVTAETVVAAG